MKEQIILPWVCVNCNNKWVDHMFATWEECPECRGDAQHESPREITDKDEWYS